MTWQRAFERHDEKALENTRGDYKCQHCNITFDKNSHLQKHVFTEHKVLKAFKCHLCEKNHLV